MKLIATYDLPCVTGHTLNGKQATSARIADVERVDPQQQKDANS